MPRLALLAVLAFLSALQVLPAHAALNLCNRTSYVVYAATAVPTDGNVATKGWTRLAPGDCSIALAGDLIAPAYFVYARTSLAHSGPSRAWGGADQFCVRDVNFALQTKGGVDCGNGDSFALPFAQLDTHHMRSWTMTLTESPALQTLNAARLAGLKRLLRDNGLKVGAINGGPDKQAAASLIAFRTRMRLSDKASTADLFDALETDAMKMTAPAGYAVCNDTEKPILVALGQQSGAAWVSHGWWTVAAGSCAKTITKPLAADKVWLHAVRQNGAPLVIGASQFCVTNIEFDIQGRDRCKERGLDSAGFAETVTKGQTGYAAHIGDEGLLLPYAFHAGTSK